MWLPLIPHARKSAPRWAAAARTLADTVAEMVEQSTSTLGPPAAENSPPGPEVTSSTSAGVETVVNTTSRPDRSTIDSAT